MGLGPSFCRECEVFLRYTPNVIKGRQGTWACPFNAKHPREDFFFVSKEIRDRVSANDRFIKFVLKQ